MTPRRLTLPNLWLYRRQILPNPHDRRLACVMQVERVEMPIRIVRSLAPRSNPHDAHDLIAVATPIRNQPSEIRSPPFPNPSLL